MTFSVRQSAADLKLEPFPFEGMDGNMYELPNIKSIPLELAAGIYEGNLIEVLEQIAPDCVAQLKAMPIGVVEPFTLAWQAHSEQKPGESVASSASGASTARPSSSTSRATAASKTRKR